MAFLRACIAALLLLAAPFPASAAGRQDFTLINRTGYGIHEVYVAPSTSRSWEEDVMGRNTLDNGSEVDVQFDRKERVCGYDLKVVFSDGSEAEWLGFDLCTVSTITLYYNAKTRETTAEYE